MSDDPLDGADLGETHHVEETSMIWAFNQPSHTYGSDRDSDVELVDTEVVRDEDGRVDAIRLHWEGDITKTLPRGYNRIAVPSGSEHVGDPVAHRRRKQRREKWVGRLKQGLGLGIPVLGSTFVALHVINATASQISINGDTLGPITFAEAAPPMLLIVILAAVIVWGLQGGFPGMAGGHR